MAVRPDEYVHVSGTSERHFGDDDIPEEALKILVTLRFGHHGPRTRHSSRGLVERGPVQRALTL